MAAKKRPVWSGDWPLPKVIHLPGVRIRVKLMNSADMEAVGGLYGNWMYAPPTADRPDAVIYINQEWPVEFQRYILWHELQHAMVETVDVLLEKFPEHVQTKAMMTLASVKAKDIELGVSK